MIKFRKSVRAAVAGLLAAALLPCAGVSETKRDVSDPVLSEIIQNFSPRMPRFIDKHGKDVFVTDETLTRGGLMLALYEYDKSLKLPKKEAPAISRTEFDQLSARLGHLETAEKEKISARAAAVPEPAPEPLTLKSQTDIMQVINDLIPNMPVILDSSLNNSKVFSGLREEVMNRKPAADDKLAAGLDQTKKDLLELAKKVESIDKPAVLGAPQAQPVLQRDQEQYLQKDIQQTKTQLSKLEKRLAELESQKLSQSQQPVRMNADQGEVKGYASMLAKISMGLSMVAALFMAR